MFGFGRLGMPPGAPGDPLAGLPAGYAYVTSNGRYITSGGRYLIVAVQ